VLFRSIVATITSPDIPGGTLSLDKFLTDDGRVPDALVTVEEELTAEGVNGRRFRDVSDRYPSFTVQTIETCTTYVAAVARCRAYDALIGTNVRLIVSDLAGSSYTFPRVHVSAAVPRAVPGSVAGSAAGASHAAHVACTLSMVVMDVTAGLNP
jgi:hypothetical protein